MLRLVCTVTLFGLLTLQSRDVQVAVEVFWSQYTEHNIHVFLYNSQQNCM